ncbi:MAG: glycerate kinase [Muribaculaceae bacterium]|nr:glycerate kinase [Muribaculaceae bacterium]
MKVVIAPDSFKGCLPADEVANAIAEGVRDVFCDAHTVVMPVADGGEGTSRIIAGAVGAERMDVMAVDPLRRPVNAVWYKAGSVAYLDVAADTALSLLSAEEYDPFETDSYGTGMLIEAALDAGCRKIFVGLGGSATVDAGVGMALALGMRFADGAGCECNKATQVMSADSSGVDKRLGECEVVLMSDVSNPLVGINGAARVFGPQKGASAQWMVDSLDKALARVADVVGGNAGESGAGAAGGIGFMLKALVTAAGGNVSFRSGAECVLDILQFETAAADSDIVISGEGHSDEQTLMGKIPYVVMRMARCLGVNTVLLVGGVDHRDRLIDAGFMDVCPINPLYADMSDAMMPDVARSRLRETARQLMLRLM